MFVKYLCLEYFQSWFKTPRIPLPLAIFHILHNHHQSSSSVSWYFTSKYYLHLLVNIVQWSSPINELCTDNALSINTCPSYIILSFYLLLSLSNHNRKRIDTNTLNLTYLESIIMYIIIMYNSAKYFIFLQPYKRDKRI